MYCQYCETELDDTSIVYNDGENTYFYCPTCGLEYCVEYLEEDSEEYKIISVNFPKLDARDLMIHDDLDEKIEEILQEEQELIQRVNIKYWYYIISGTRPNGFKASFDGIIQVEGEKFPLKNVLQRFTNKDTTYIVESVAEISQEDYEWFYSENSKFKGFK